MNAQEARDHTIDAIKKTITVVANSNKSHIHVPAIDISYAVKEQMETEGYNFELVMNMQMPRHKRTVIIDVYRISW